MATLVRTDRHGTVAVLTLDLPPVNALSDALRRALDHHVRVALDDPSVDALVITGAGRAFVAGADIREFEQVRPESPPAAHVGELLDLIERAPKPVVMAINGVAFGGGLELAMAGHYRLASPSAQVGQPEVTLGLVPGAGGTQRLPRLAGPAVAARMCACGEPVTAQAACADGLLDRVVETDLLAAAVEFAAEAARRSIPRTRDRLERLGLPGQHAAMFAEIRALAARRMKGQTAPLLAVDLVEAATTLPFDAGCAREQEAFRRCLAGAQSKSLIHVFFGERVVSKVPGVPVAPEPLPIHSVAVVGAGTMGRGIAMSYANAGIPVVLKESTGEALDHGLQAIRHTYASAVQKGRLTRAEADRRLALVTPTTSYDQFHGADLVVEAVFEEIEIKERVFAELEAATRADAILATNTSYLDVDRIAAATSRPSRVVGHHFFSPAHVMRLLEIVRGRETAPEILGVSLALARRLGKIGVVVGNGRGFVGNRLYEPFVRESVFLVEEGVEPERLDRALTDFGMAMGPLAVQDLSGLDVGWRIRKAFAHLRVPGARTPFANDLLCEMGRFGQKTGAGWYLYDAERRASVDAGLVRHLRAAARERGIPEREIDDREMVDRLVLSLVNEGARALEEGVALRAVDIDIIYINGYGFPAWRGGPMKYADLTGLGPVLDRIREFQGRDPHHWQAAPLLERLAGEGRSFAAFDEERAR